VNIKVVDTQNTQVNNPELARILKQRLTGASGLLATAEAEVTRLKRHIEALRETIITLEPSAAPPNAPLPSGSLFEGHDRSLADMSIKEATRIVLRDRSPMKVRELLEVLQKGGKRIGGQVPSDTLRAILRNYDEVFKKTPDAKWTLLNGDNPEDQDKPF